MIEEVLKAGKAVAEACRVLESECANVKLKDKVKEEINAARLVMTIALNHCRSAYRHTEQYTLLRDRAKLKPKKGA